ncbi:MAG: hypothetical protein HYZ42_05585 [Bacteroidetes bacterium]|nr:hypothetical protein [Bacteroidota bacterium]
MKKLFLLVLFFSSSISVLLSQGLDTNLVVKLYSGFGEHTLKKNYRIIYKLNYVDGYNRTKIKQITPDSIFLSNGSNISIRKISEIGYYSKQDKTIKAVGLVIIALGGVLAWQYAKDLDPTNSFTTKVGGLTPTVVSVGIGSIFVFMKRKLYKIPNPWQIQTSRELKGGFIYR